MGELIGASPFGSNPKGGLGARLHNGRGKCPEIVQLFGNDGLDYIEIQTGVFVHGYVAEADHPLHAGCQIC